MIKWIVRIPVVGEDYSYIGHFTREQQALLEELIDGFIRTTALEPRVEWV